MPVSLGARVEREGAPLSVASSSVPCRCRSAGDAYAPTAHSADWGAATLGSRGADGGGGGCGCHGEGGGGLLVPLLFCRLAAGRPRGAEVQVADSTAALERWGRRGLRNSAGGAGSVHGSGRALRKPAPPCGFGWVGPSSDRFWLDFGMTRSGRMSEHKRKQLLGRTKEFKQNNSLSQQTGSTQVRTGAC